MAGSYGRLVKKAMHKRGDDAGAGIAETVHKQLAEDFPERWTAWARSAHWKGPIDVPIDSVDFAHRKTWSADEDPKKIAHFRKDIRDGSVKPAILVNEPNNEKMIIADGHHRALAAKAEGVPVRAYVATVNTVRGDWDHMHASQKGREGDGKKG